MPLPPSAGCASAAFLTHAPFTAFDVSHRSRILMDGPDVGLGRAKTSLDSRDIVMRLRAEKGMLRNGNIDTIPCGGVGDTVTSESALRSAGTLLSRVRAPPPAPWPDGGPESLRSPCCGLAIYKNQKPNHLNLQRPSIAGSNPAGTNGPHGGQQT
ncbi:hypothetical protein PoB_000735900 [Plakobranchus ocellatus]|uniref:Uncharacterized protein n=1 Tax=Plakobranchus ocellatus TaxID=259542 RepID=A0AAV3YEZ3_9GAST|nr:hypothetical protein PoB_000735900 [Plakobranchus ocellatus]